ncbi:spore coat protein regulator protein YlbO [Geobacillus sp. CAMR12739]|nr:spore coat protein regulator protein YlbO [Geobacillus sp. CAMR12739]
MERRLKEVEAENIVLKELAYQSAKRYEQLKQLAKENDELRRQLLQSPWSEKTGKTDEDERPDSWFFPHTEARKCHHATPGAKRKMRGTLGSPSHTIAVAARFFSRR